MAERRTCGHYSCEYYKHNHFSEPVLPNGKCVYSSQELKVKPGDNCKFELLEKTVQSAQSQPLYTKADEREDPNPPRVEESRFPRLVQARILGQAQQRRCR